MNARKPYRKKEYNHVDIEEKSVSEAVTLLQAAAEGLDDPYLSCESSDGYVEIHVVGERDMTDEEILVLMAQERERHKQLTESREKTLAKIARDDPELLRKWAEKVGDGTTEA